ncbi:MAG TPA: NADH-quinone oxidoreductase subunit N [Vicinamibacteria bacterium]|jgi:NADH-quinone oxidoreductase subunit N
MSETLDLRPVIPAALVALTGLVTLLAQAFTPKGQRAPSAALSLAGLSGALASVWLLGQEPMRGAVLAGALSADGLSLFLQAVILAVAIVTVLLTPGYLSANGIERGEHYALLLFSVVGMLGLVSSLELVSMFVALEIMSVALYGLAGIDRARRESQEAALKYFITGSFASAFFLYGVALVYGVTGSTSIERVTRALGVMGPEALPLAMLGTAMLLVGFGFKIASVPFHMWTPDVYEGAPTTVTAFMSAGVKAAAFGALLRVFDGGLFSLASHWQPLVAALAIVTMLLGNLAALAQTSLKRLLAYSSIAHAGYLMTALVARPALASEAILFYLVAYAAVNLGAFGVIAALARDGREPATVADLAGLSERRPALAAALTVFLVSLTGIPVTAGFVGKFNLFAAAISAGNIGIVLAIVGMLTSVVSAYYYLRVVVAMYMEPPLGEDNFAAVPAAAVLALVLSAGVTLLFGLWPTPVLTLARLASRGLF